MFYGNRTIWQRWCGSAVARIHSVIDLDTQFSIFSLDKLIMVSKKNFGTEFFKIASNSVTSRSVF